jgi:hypothetical protein
MANRATTVLDIDDAAGLRKIANFKKELGGIGNVNPRTASGNDALMQRAQTDIARMQRQTADGERNLTRLIEREAEQQFRAKTRAYQRSTEAAVKELQRIRAAESRGFTGGGEGSALAAGLTGGLIGGGIVGGVVAATAATTQLASAVTDLAVQSVRLAGDFEMTVNAMTVFAGSTAAAKAELDALKKLSENTPGLGLRDAELGATRLRALGFQIDLTTDLLEGLAKQRLLSGASADALERVTINLAQLSTGAGDFQDIKDLVTNLPTLRKEIIEAFGSLKNFQNALANDPTGALKRFAEEIAAVRVPTAGLNDAIQKLGDSFISTGRVIGEPILDPLTRDIKDLTSVVGENSNEFRKLGTDIADVYRGASQLTRLFGFGGGGLAENIKNFGESAVAGSGGLGMLAVGITKVLGFAGGQQRESEAAASARLAAQFRNFNAGSLNADFTIAAPEASRTPFRAVSGDSPSARLYQQNREDEALKNYFRQESSVRLSEYNTFLQRQKGGIGGIENALNTARTDRRLTESDRSNLIYQLTEQMERARKEIAEKAKQTRAAISDIFVGSAGRNNEFVTYFDDARKAVERASEATKGLSENVRSSILDFVRQDNAAAGIGFRLSTALNVLDLRREAGEFRAERRLEDTDVNLQARIRDQFRAIGAAAGFGNGSRDLIRRPDGMFRAQDQNNGLDSIRRSVIDRSVIELTRGIDPARLTPDLNRLAAAAREREATRITSAEREAERLTSRLNTLLDGISSGKGLPVAIVDGQSTVRFVDESNGRVKDIVTQPSQGDVNRRYTVDR